MHNLSKQDFLNILDTYEATLDSCRDRGEFLNRYERGRLLIALIDNYMSTLGRNEQSWGYTEEDE